MCFQKKQGGIWAKGTLGLVYRTSLPEPLPHDLLRIKKIGLHSIQHMWLLSEISFSGDNQSGAEVAGNNLSACDG